MPNAESNSDQRLSPRDELARSLLGRVIGDFEIRREIGRGGMGFVFEAWQISLQRVVALKVLAGSANLTGTAVQRFQREAQAAAKLHHTNIVPIFAQGEHDGVHYYAMELVHGRSIYEIIQEARGGGDSSGCGVTETRPIDGDTTVRGSDSGTSGSSTGFSSGSSSNGPQAGNSAAASTWASVQARDRADHYDTIARLTATVAEALEYAHQSGVIHRDIKPHNLILGDDGRLCVTDFGLARVLEGPAVTVTGEFMGSPMYMSPEQISGMPSRIDHRTDIYSLGATLYEWLTLRPMFPGQTREHIVSQILTSEPDPPRAYSSAVPLDLETICLKAVEKDANRRFNSAAEMAADLRRFLGGNAIRARRAGPIARAGKFVQRHRVASVAAVLAFVILLFGVAWFKARREVDTIASEADAAIEQTEAKVAAVENDRNELAGALADVTQEGDEFLAEAKNALAGIEQGKRVEAAIRQNEDPLDKFRRGQQLIQDLRSASAEPSAPESSLDDQFQSLASEIAERLADDLISAQLEMLSTMVDGAMSNVASGSADEYYFRALVDEDHATAVAWLDQALQEDANHQEARCLRAALLCRAGQYDEMVEEARRLTQARDDSARGHLLLGGGQLLAGNGAAAIEALNRVEEIDGRTAWLHVLRGAAFARDENLITAMQEYNFALSMDPDHVVARLARGKAHYYMGSYDAALGDADKLVELLPEGVPAHVFRGECRDKLLDFRGAVSDYNKAIALGDDSMALGAKLFWAMANAKQQDIRERAAAALDESDASAQDEDRQENTPPGARRENIDWVREQFRKKFGGDDSPNSGSPPAATGYPFGGYPPS